MLLVLCDVKRRSFSHVEDRADSVVFNNNNNDDDDGGGVGDDANNNDNDDDDRNVLMRPLFEQNIFTLLSCFNPSLWKFAIS